MPALRIRGGKQIGVAAVLEFEFVAQLRHGKREVAHGDIRMRKSGQSLLQLLFVHRGD